MLTQAAIKAGQGKAHYKYLWAGGMSVFRLFFYSSFHGTGRLASCVFAINM